MGAQHASSGAVAGSGTARSSGRADPWLWLAGGMLVFLLVPLIGADLLGLQPDLYYLGYFTIAVAWFVAFVLVHEDDLRGFWHHHLGRSLLVGLLVGPVLMAIVLNQSGTDRPDGWRLAFEVLWRGLVYGAVDALILFVFPAAVAHLLTHGDREGVRRKVGFAALALALSMLITAAYHLGYPEYRDRDLRSPEIGAVMGNLPAMLTGNPLGAVVAHDAAHVTAVVHANEGGPAQMLPPKVTADYPSRGDSDVAAAPAILWMVAAAGGLTLLVRHRRTTADAG